MPDSSGPTSIALAGDVMLGRLVNGALDARGPEHPWARVRHLVDASDAFFFNLECAVCGDLPEWEPEAKTFHFRMDPKHLATLAASGVDAVMLANNHVLDFDVAGLEETLAHLDAAGVARAGAGMDADEARAPAAVDVNGVRVALLSFADHLEEWSAGDGVPGINWTRIATRESDFAPIREAIRGARDDADCVVFGIHWGPNMRVVPPPHFRAFARAVMEAGADAFFGTSAHVFQGVGTHLGRPILFDAGDFVDDYAVDPDLRNDRTFLFRLTWEDGAFRELRADPMRIRDFQVAPAIGEDHRWSTERLVRLSRDLGARLEPDGAGLRLRLAPGVPAAGAP